MREQVGDIIQGKQNQKRVHGGIKFKLQNKEIFTL